MAKHIKHNKLKNSGILFELLIRKVAADSLSGKTVSEALSILNKHFAVSSTLGKELQLYRSFIENTKVLSESRGLEFITLIVNQHKKLNEKTLLEEKYNLIKDIKKSYDLKEFLSPKIPQYKLYASIFKMFESERCSDSVTNVQDIVESKFTLLEHLVTPPKTKVSNTKISQTLSVEPEEIRVLTYNILVEKFNNKYNSLNSSQKSFIKEYIGSLSNQKKFTDTVRARAKLLEERLITESSRLDKVMQIKVSQVALEVGKIVNKESIKESDLTKLMIGYSIEDELRNV